MTEVGFNGFAACKTFKIELLEHFMALRKLQRKSITKA
jgi:hypothetical protein